MKAAGEESGLFVVVKSNRLYPAGKQKSIGEVGKMRLYFIRHGQSENNLLWEETGSNHGRSDDPELTPAGREQARLLADYIRECDDQVGHNKHANDGQRDFFGITHLYTSLMVRSVATGSYLSKAIGVPLTAWPEIHECGGIFQSEPDGTRIGCPGKTRSYFSENYPHLALPDSLTDEGWWNRPFEADEDRPLRAKQVVQTLLERHPGEDDTVAIISHGGFYVELMRVLFQVGNLNSWFLMNNTGISRFDFRSESEVALIYQNRTTHLPERLVT
jgi:2,3-bisphosphoglycerate-dependent phosphoglycerate mutase